MSSTFLIWKDASCNGKNIEWVELTLPEFKQFKHSPESRGRYFIKLGNEVCPEADFVEIEATYEQYQNWRAEMRHHFYLQSVNPGYSEVSIDSTNEKSGLLWHEIIAAAGFTPEEITVDNETQNHIWMAISSLNESRRNAILAKFCWYPGKSDEEIAKLIGEDFESFAKRKYRALCQLKNFLELECPIF